MSTVPEIAEYDRAVARKVRGARAERRVMQQTIADALGISQVAVSRRMNGRTPFEVGELAMVAEVLGCEMADLLPAQRPGSATGGYPKRLTLIPGGRRPALRLVLGGAA